MGRVLIDYPLQPQAEAQLASAGIDWILAAKPHREPVAAFLRTLPENERRGIEILIGDAFQVDSELLALLPGLRWVHHFAAGLSDARQPDWELIEERGIAVSTSKIQAVSVSELAVALLLALTKKLDETIRDQDGRRYDPTRMPEMLANKTALVIGTGNIGAAIAGKLANGFDMRVLGINEDGAEIPNFARIGKLEDVDGFLPQADAVVLACPLTDATRGIMDEARIARMKDTTYLVNIARGQLVDQAALVRALNAGRIAGAALDVLEVEPPPEGDGIWRAKNLILTPHIAGSNRDYSIGMVGAFLKNLPHYLEGRPERMPTYANANRY